MRTRLLLLAEPFPKYLACVEAPVPFFFFFFMNQRHPKNRWCKSQFVHHLFSLFLFNSFFFWTDRKNAAMIWGRTWRGQCSRDGGFRWGSWDVMQFEARSCYSACLVFDHPVLDVKYDPILLTWASTYRARFTFCSLHEKMMTQSWSDLQINLRSNSRWDLCHIHVGSFGTRRRDVEVTSRNPQWVLLILSRDFLKGRSDHNGDNIQMDPKETGS
jgi:hypothetical protein